METSVQMLTNSATNATGKRLRTTAAALALEYPIQVEVAEWNPLPDGVTNASLPMFYALVVILAGFTGAMIISGLLDARLGFIPLEIGPLALHVHVAPFGRLQTLARKWAVTVITAPLVSGLVLWVAHGLGIGGFDPWHMFWFSNLVIAAVGVCAHTIIAAIGTGIGEDEFSTKNARYGKIIIMTDADVDGAHIRTLLLTFFFRYMTPLITNGHLFIAQPPLYLISAGKKSFYAYTESQREEILKSLPNADRASLQRYKGLGEMNPEQLWDTTMDPANRTLLQVTIEDAAEADRVFDMLMGSSVPPRKRFITTHAKKATLDV